MNIEEVLKGLNDGQLQAVKHLNGPALTTATAGAGKTRVIVNRTQYMILNGVDPASILLTTFTNKAANEMKERIVKVVGEKGKLITVGTYHSICNRILRNYADKIGYNKNFTILDDTETDKIIKAIADANGVDKTLVKISISSFKLKCKTPRNAHEDVVSDSDRQLANCYSDYQDELKRQMAMDFDDLLLNAVLLMENNADVLKEINNRWKHINCDEVQDSSGLDSRLTYLLSGSKHNIFMVGDDFQSVYGFRGADMTIMLGLNELYPGIKTYNLGINYRSTETIVNIGKSIIENNTMQLEKEVSCGRGVSGMKGVITTCKTQDEQSKKVVAYIKTLHKKGLAYKDIAILYRANYLSRSIEKILMENQIKYRLYGGIPFFNRMEIQDMLSYARLTINPYDFQAFKRSIAVPKRGIGDKTIDKIDDFCRENNLPIRDALVHPRLGLKGKAKASIEDYVKTLEELDKAKIELAPKEFLQKLLMSTGYYTYIMDKYKGEEQEERMANITELMSVAKEYDNIEELITQAQLYKDEVEEDEDAVQLMTIHKSKGLEFKAVIMIDMAEGTLPFHKSLSDKMQIEEERRLAFVGVTRAQDFLFMIYPQNQVVGGQHRYVKMSRFLKEIDTDLIIKN